MELLLSWDLYTEGKNINQMICVLMKFHMFLPSIMACIYYSTCSPLTSVTVGSDVDPLGGRAGQRVAALVALCTVTVVGTVALRTRSTLEEGI